MCVAFLNNSKSVVEWLLLAIKKTDHVISPNQTVSYKSRFYRRGWIKVSWQKKCVWKTKSGEIKKTTKMTACWEPKALWIKVLWQKLCLNNQSLEKKKTSKMSACWEPEASCSSCNQTLEGHPEDYTMIFPPPARWEGKAKMSYHCFLFKAEAGL